MSDDPLEQLVRQGRELSDRDRERADGVRAEGEREVAREWQIRLGSSLSWFARWGWWTFGSILGLVAAVVAGRYIIGETDDDVRGSLGTLAAMVIGLAPISVLWLVRHRFGNRAVEEEQAWASSLPFRLANYPAALGGARTEGTAGLVIRFGCTSSTIESVSASFREPAARVVTTTLPTDERLFAVARAVGSRLDPTSTKDATTRRFTYEIEFMDESVSHNAHLARWVHQACDALVVVHASHPIEEVWVEPFS